MTTSQSQKMNALDLVRLVCRALDDKKADNIQVLDVSAQSSITDYLVIATGTSEPHLRALRVELEKVLDAAKVRILGMDTQQGSGWLVVDAFDVMVHLFTGQMRAHYGLEVLWKDAVEISVPRLLAPATEAAPAKSKTTATVRKSKAPKAAKAPKTAKAATKAGAKTGAKKTAKKKAPAKTSGAKRSGARVKNK